MIIQSSELLFALFGPVRHVCPFPEIYKDNAMLDIVQYDDKFSDVSFGALLEVELF